MMLKTLLPVSWMLPTALVVLLSSVTFVTSFKVTKNANTPTARMMSDTTTPMIAPGSMNPNLHFIDTTSCLSDVVVHETNDTHNSTDNQNDTDDIEHAVTRFLYVSDCACDVFIISCVLHFV